MLHITKRSEFNFQVHLHKLHVCFLYASFSPNGPDKKSSFIPKQSPNYRNHTGIDAKRGETPPRYFFTITFGINKIIAPKIRET